MSSVVDPVLKAFLKTVALESGQKNATHGSLMKPDVGNYKITDTKLNQFYDIYCTQLLLKGNKFMSGLAERPFHEMPILADIDIKKSISEGLPLDRHFYKKEHVDAIIKIYQDVLRSVVDDICDFNLLCFVLEKPKPYVYMNQFKNGFHLHWPFLYLSASDQHVHVYPRVIEAAKRLNFFEDDLGIAKDDIENVIDKAFNKNWLMYGSRKDVEFDAYWLTRIVTADGNDVEGGPDALHSAIFDYPARDFLVDTDGRTIIGDNDIDFYLPRILSVNPYGRPIKKIKKDIPCVGKDSLVPAAKSTKIIEQLSVTQMIAKIDKLLPLLSPTRATQRDSWMHVGWLLWNLTDGSKEGLERWITFSKTTTANNFDESICVELWFDMQPGSYTLGTLKFWARSDNPTGYSDYLLKEQRIKVSESVQGGHVDIAMFLYNEFYQDFVCANIQRQTWYYFNGTRWEVIDSGYLLDKQIDNVVLPRWLDEAQKPYHIYLEECKADGLPFLSSEDHTVRRKKLLSIVGLLKSSSFKSGVMRECAKKFHVPRFEKNLDANPNLLGFDNGVLDVTTGHFRKGKPSDYITFSTGYEYKEYTSWSDPLVVELIETMRKIFLDEDVRHYFLEVCALVLVGGNPDQEFTILDGSGANGKSFLVNLLAETLGSDSETGYATTLPTAFVTRPEPDSSSANSALASTKGKRLATVLEPSSNDPVNQGVIKRMTGDDKINARQLYKCAETFTPQYKFWYICNVLPTLELENDTGMDRRLLRFEFKSRFPAWEHEVPKTIKEQEAKRIFPRDNTLTKRIPSFRQPFMWILVMFLRSYIARGYKRLPRPPMVSSATDELRARNDVYKRFINALYIRDDTPGTYITVNDFYTEFKKWRTVEGIKGATAPSRQEVEAIVSKKSDWGIPYKGRWFNWRLRTEQDEAKEVERELLQKQAKAMIDNDMIVVNLEDPVEVNDDEQTDENVQLEHHEQVEDEQIEDEQMQDE